MAGGVAAGQQLAQGDQALAQNAYAMQQKQRSDAMTAAFNRAMGMGDLEAAQHIDPTSFLSWTKTQSDMRNAAAKSQADTWTATAVLHNADIAGRNYELAAYKNTREQGEYFDKTAENARKTGFQRLLAVSPAEAKAKYPDLYAGYEKDQGAAQEAQWKAKIEGLNHAGNYLFSASTPEQWDHNVTALAAQVPEMQQYLGRFGDKAQILAGFAGAKAQFEAQAAAERDRLNREADPAEVRLLNALERDPELKALYLETKRAGRSTTTVNNNLGDKVDAYQHESNIKKIDADEPAALGAARGIELARRARKNLDTSITGFGGESRKKIAAAMNLLGYGNSKEIVATENVQAALGEAALSVLKSYVGSTNISDADREAVQRTVGDIGQNKATIGDLMDLLEAKGTKVIERFNKNLEPYPLMQHRRVEIPSDPKAAGASNLFERDGKVYMELPLKKVAK